MNGINIKEKLHRVISLLLIIFIVLSITGCAAEQSSAQDIRNINAFRDIPGITDEEIAIIEELIETRQGFNFGSIISLDAYYDTDGTVTGFIPQLCNLLTDLFGVQFIPGIFEWYELVDGIESHTINFTASINKLADMESSTIHSATLAGNKLTAFVNSMSAHIISEYDMQGLKVGFFDKSHTEEITRRSFPYVDFESIMIKETDEMADKLLSGEIDVFIAETADVFEFYGYSHVEKTGALPYEYIPVTISTSDKELEPVISAINKYLMAGGITEIERLYADSEREYAAHAIWQTLNGEERDYINNMRNSGAKIPYGATSSRYPVAFYNYDINDFDGIAIDVLREISTLTGLEFYPKCDETTTWGELEGMLKTGEISLLSQLIPNEARAEYAIWPDEPYFTARYALLSNIDTPFLSINQVPYQTVGFSGGTAEEARYKAWFPEDTSYVTFTFSDDGLSALERGEIDLFFSLDYTMLYESNYRQNPNQKINILFDTPVEPVPFGLNINEEILCSIISKTQKIINTDRIVRSWTSRIVDRSAVEEAERSRLYMIFSACLLVLLTILLAFFARSQKLKRSVENQARETLQANQNLRVLIDLAPVGIVITRRGDGELLYANRSALDVYTCGDFDEDVKGRKSLDFMPAIQSDGTPSENIVKNFWRNTDGTAEAEFIKKTGEIFIARVVYRAIDFQGGPASLNIIEDMTAERKHKQMLENIAAKEQEANQLKSRFLATMSHEIRTPMNAIIGMTELALREQDESTVREHILTIKEAGDNLLSILSDILDFSKIEAGKMDIINDDYYIASILHDLVNIIRMRVIHSTVCFTVRVDSNVPGVLYGDETRVRQVILNLLSNAAKYTEKGYISLSVYCKYTGENTLDMIFEVKDTGIGIKQEDMGILFNDFTQLELEKNKRIDGIGLGLTISRSIVDKMGGEIIVDSQYGKGSTFTVRLPQKFDKPDKLAAVKSPDKHNILIYTGNDIYNESLTYSFENMGIGHTVTGSDNDFQSGLESGLYNYLFITYDLYSKNEDIIKKLGADISIALLTEFGENNSIGGNILNKNISILTLPVYCTTIADVLNGVYDSASTPPGSEPTEKFTAPRAKVLIVDDIMSNLKVAEGLLLPYDMQVELADSGAAAISILKKAAGDRKADEDHFYDLIFMDHKMPIMDGVETVQRIRALGGVFAKVPIIALTANTVSGIIDMFLESGFNDFISKPIDTVKLNAILEKWIPDSKKE